MRELALREAHKAALEIPAPAMARFRETRAAIKARSMIVWGEHCSECAFPSCYSNCDFYTPRGDMHGRRFLNGIEAVTITSAPA